MAATRGVLLYLLSCFSLAIVLAYFINDYSFRADANKTLLLSSLNSAESSEAKVWPELKFGWRLMLASVIGFLGSACGSVGGIGGGGIFVSTLNLLLGFDTKSAAAISKCMIMGACTSSVWYNLRVAHPFRQVPIIDYDLALLFQPMLMLGITIGVSLSVVFPYWLITVLIIILFMGTSTRSLSKGIGMWKKETISKKAMEEYKRKNAPTLTSVVIDAHYVPLAADKDETITMEKTTMQIVRGNLNMNRIMVLLLVWSCFLLLQIIKNGTKACSPLYWFLNLLQLPIALALTGYKCVQLYKENKRRKIEGNFEPVCEAAIEWTPTNLAFCAFCGVVGGTVGGLLGSGGGFVLGPLLLEIKVIPQVASATATFVMMFSASLSVVEFYLLDRFPMPYALYLMGVSMLAGFGGQFVVSKIVAILKRPSIIVFILSSVIFVSAVVMGVVGIQKSITKINNHEFVGFLDFCSSQ